jgi:hypothetical protein
LRPRKSGVDSPHLSVATPAAELPFGYSGAYWLDLRGYDPVATAAALDKPMLILQGGRDYRVTVKDDLSGWQAALAQAPKWSTTGQGVSSGSEVGKVPRKRVMHSCRTNLSRLWSAHRFAISERSNRNPPSAAGRGTVEIRFSERRRRFRSLLSCANSEVITVHPI